MNNDALLHPTPNFRTGFVGLHGGHGGLVGLKINPSIPSKDSRHEYYYPGQHCHCDQIDIHSNDGASTHRPGDSIMF